MRWRVLTQFVQADLRRLNFFKIGEFYIFLFNLFILFMLRKLYLSILLKRFFIFFFKDH